MSQALLQEKIWFCKPHADDAEKHYYESLGNPKTTVAETKPAAEKVSVSTHSSNLDSRVLELEKEEKDTKNVVQEILSALSRMEARIASLEQNKPTVNGVVAQQTKPTPVAPKNNKNTKKDEEEDDDDIDLFGSDNEDDIAANELRDKRLNEYAAKKSKKPALVAKSSVVLDIKPWDDETDMTMVEKSVRGIQMDGLVWGASKLVPLAYGIKKLQIVTIVEDDKVSIDLLQEKIEEFEELVQSVDIAAFNKL